MSAKKNACILKFFIFSWHRRKDDVYIHVANHIHLP